MIFCGIVLRDTCAPYILNGICEARWLQFIQIFKTVYVKVARPRGFEPLSFASGGTCSLKNDIYFNILKIKISFCADFVIDLM